MSFLSKIMSKELTVTRKTKAFVDGFSVEEQGGLTFTIKGSVQPLTGKEILQVAEGDRNRRHINIFTQDEAKVDDKVLWKEDLFEIQTVECWEFDGPCELAHYKIRAVQCDA